jgi:hypothetical protein
MLGIIQSRGEMIQYSQSEVIIYGKYLFCYAANRFGLYFAMYPNTLISYLLFTETPPKS